MLSVTQNWQKSKTIYHSHLKRANLFLTKTAHLSVTHVFNGRNATRHRRLTAPNKSNNVCVCLWYNTMVHRYRQQRQTTRRNAVYTLDAIYFGMRDSWEVRLVRPTRCQAFPTLGNHQAFKYIELTVTK